MTTPLTAPHESADGTNVTLGAPVTPRLRPDLRAEAKRSPSTRRDPIHTTQSSKW